MVGSEMVRRYDLEANTRFFGGGRMIKGKFYTNDDEFVFIYNEDDLANLVAEKISYEAAQLVRELADLADSTKQRLDSDLLAYETQLESQRSAFMEINDHVHRLLNLTHRAKIEKSYKEQMLVSLETIQKEVSNQL